MRHQPNLFQTPRFIAKNEALGYYIQKWDLPSPLLALGDHNEYQIARIMF
jgi:hypothetical protein